MTEYHQREVSFLVREALGTRDLAGLRAFAATTEGVRACILAYNGTEALRLGESLFAIPFGLLFS